MNAKKGRTVFISGPQGSGPPPPENHPDLCPSRPPRAHDIRVRRETGGRGGKTVTTAGPFFLTREEASSLLRSLKKKCSSGGTLKPADGPEKTPGWVLEIQGDQVDRILAELADLGYRGKRAGG